MKRFLILLIICTSSSWSQEVKTQKEILQLQNTDLVKDFNLKTKGNIKPVMVNKSTYNDVGFGFVDKKFSYAKKDYSQKILTFKETKLTSYNSQFHYNFGTTNGFDFKYFYDEKGNLKEMTSKSSSSNYISKTSYTYSSNNKIKKINETGTYADGKKYDKITNYIYKGNLISYDFENGSKTIHLKNNLVTKQVTFNKSANKTYTDSYQYNSNGFLTYEDKGTSKYTYTFNNKNLLKTVISKNHTSHYKYVYDKYGNWIVAYQLAISEKDYSGNKISPHLYGSRFAFHVREIKYSNGDVTGSVIPENPKTKNEIIRIRTELYDNLVEENISYRKTAKSSYLFKMNGQQEAKNTASGFMDRSLLVFHKPTKQLFICEGFGDKEEGKDFPAKKIDIDTKNGYWYRTPKGIIHVFKADGTYIEKFKVFKYATNGIDAVLQENDNSTKILLENYKNTASHKVYPVKLLGSTVKTRVVKKGLQKDVFSLPKTNIVEDYNLKIGKGSIIPKQIDEKQFDQRTKRGTTEIATMLERTKAWYFDTKNKRITSNSIIYRDQKTTIKYIYDSKGNLLMHNYNSPTFKYTDTFTYDDDGTFRYVRIYDGDSNSSRHTFKKTDYGYMTIGITNIKYYLKNNLVQKSIANYNRSEPSEDTFTYNNLNQKVKDDSSFATIEYVYNSSGDIETYIESSKHTNTVTTRNHVYKYDKYGNWIISLSLINLSYAKGISSFPNPKLRKITYSNGEVTGTTDIDKVKNELIALRKRVRSLITNTNNQVATWKKTNKDNFHFYIGNKTVSKAKNSFMGSHLLFLSLDNNQLYILENFDSSPINKTLSVKKITIDITNGYWFKKPNGAVVVHTGSGEYIKKSKLFAYARNQIDVLYQGENQSKKVVLENYKNAKVHKVYPVINYDSYDENKIVNNNPKKKESPGKCVKGNCENGYGEYEFENGFKADGFFENGKPNGPMHLNDKAKNESRFSTYKGSYENSVGMTYRYYKNRYTDIIDHEKQIGVTNDATEKRTYKLNFKNGKAVSKTEMTGHNINSGCIIGNCTSGSGVYIYNNGAMYFGTFQNGKRHGFGKLDFKGGNLYVGEFQNGNYHGLGTYVWSEYNYYMGEYQNGKYHGKGVMYYNKDRYDAGNWENGKLTTKTNIYNKTNVYNNTTINDYTKKNTTGFNSFSSSERNTIQECNGDAKCVGSYFNSLYESNEKSLSKDQLEQKMTDYYHSLYNMDSKLAYDAIFKMKISTMKSVQIKKLPQVIQDDLKNRATKLNNAYKKDLKKKGY
tara:strand:+ start:12248 stop:16060 length:3813 start_codon:yes stop_codon:yes gene_type:complete